MPPVQRVVRQRKLNKSTPQQVLREAQIESAEYDSLQNQYHVETGVERSEENVCYSRDPMSFFSQRSSRANLDIPRLFQDSTLTIYKLGIPSPSRLEGKFWRLREG
jgi:hypothetical protein